MPVVGRAWKRVRVGPDEDSPSDQSGQVNTTLDCDAPGACLQHAASILVLDGGQPQMTSE